MAAFQQRRRQQPQQEPSQSTSSDDWAQLASPSDDDRPILLFGADTLDSSQWSVVAPPRGRPARTTSFASTLSSSTVASDPQSSLGSPSSLAQASLLPAHDGSGVFAAPADAASLVQSDALFPSVYASAFLDPDGASASDTSDAFVRGPAPPFARHDSHTSSTFSSFAGSDVSSRASSGWALTAEALSSLPTSGAHRPPGRVGGTGGELAQDEQFADDEDAASTGFTSGSDEGRQEAPERPSARQTAVARAAAAAAEKQDDDDWAHSHLAMSAGILPPSRRRRPLPNTSALERYLGPATAAVNVAVSPGVVSSALRSLSPVSSARSRFSTSSGYKRRHRRAGARDGESKKRSSASIVPLQGAYMDKIMRDEDERARRMQDLLRLRREEEELRLAQDKVLFGSTVRAYMSIEPTTLALIAATPTSSAHATPTPSRAASPMYSSKHGPASFAHQAARELRTSSFDCAEMDEVSDAETEVEGEHATSPSSTQAGAAWASYSAVVPPAASLRAAVTAPPPRPAAAASAAHRSHSASDLSSYFLRPLSASSFSGEANGLGLVLPASTTAARPHAHLMRRSSSYGSQSPAALAASPDLALLSHEERILLAPDSAAAAEAEAEASAWGGELDSFALALGYWKRLLRRLKEGAGLAYEVEGGRTPRGNEAMDEGMVGGEGGEVRVAVVH